MKIAIERLPHPEHYGDWHDKPLKWVVKGPGTELQKFSTKRDALLFARLRKGVDDMTEAYKAFLLSTY